MLSTVALVLVLVGACGDGGGSAPAVVSVSVEPSSVSLYVNGTESFTAMVTGVNDTSVVWDATCGSVVGSGGTVVFTAPGSVPAPPTCVLTATSQADASVSGSAVITIAEAPGAVIWSRAFGTSDYDWAAGVAVDGAGNVLVSGWTMGSLEATNAGGEDAFVKKYDPDGSVVWARQFGTSGDDVAWDVAVDGSGNVLVAGWTYGSLEGASAGGSDAFVRKYDADGSVVWTRQFGTSDDDFARGVAVDASGNVLVSGNTRGSLEGANAGNLDAFVRKYDADGSVVWTRQFGTSGLDGANGVAVDTSGNVLVAGWTRGSLEGVNAGGADAFVRKYDPDGTVVWTRQFGTSDDDFARGVAVDESGNVLVSGDTRGSLEGESAGGADAYVRKYDPDGSVVWTRQFGTSSDDTAGAVAVDGSGNVLVSGDTQGSLEGANAGLTDAFVRKYDADGIVVWTRQVGENSNDVGPGVAADAAGNVLAVGAIAYDAFVIKYAP